jgi:hypothetical protein
MPAEVADGVLTAVVTGTGRWLAASASAGLRGRSVRRESEIAQWFDTYELVGGGYPESPDADAVAVADWLRGNDVHAILHELLAIRMTDGPETDVHRQRDLLIRSAVAVWPSAAAVPLAKRTFAWADSEIRTLVAKLEARDPQRWRAARTDAFGARMAAVLGAIERHTAVLDTAADPVEDTAWAERYRAHAMLWYGSIVPPDFARRRTVPIGDLYVPPDIIDPDTPRTPDGGPSRSVVEHIEDRMRTRHQCPAPDGAVERLLLSGAAAVLFDGLDELVDTGRRVEVTRVVEQFCARYPLAPVLVTSRAVGYDEARLDDARFTRYVVAGFDEDRTRTYVRNWFALGDGEMGDPPDVADAFMAESATVAELRSNPLMLSYLCILYRGEGTLPRDRPGVYAKCAEMLLERWDARRGITIDLRARNLIEPALRHIAYWLFTRDGSPEVTERDLIAHTADYFHERGFEHRHDAEAAAAEFVAFCRGRAWIFSDAGTTARGDPLYRFTHRTFLEYFAAYQLAGSCDTPEQLASRLAPHVARAEWDMVGQLAVQIKDHALVRGSERIVEKLLGEKRKRTVEGRGNVLAFLARCLAFTDPSPAVVRRLSRAVLDHLTGGDPVERVRYQAFVDLVRNAFPWRDAVAEEIDSVVNREIASGDTTRPRALRWLPFLGTVFDLRGDDELGYWRSKRDDLLRRHRTAIIEVARTDDPTWLTAIYCPAEPLVSLAEALALRGRPPLAILGAVPESAFNAGWRPVVAGILAATDHEAIPGDAADTILVTELGDWLVDRDPPYFTSTLDARRSTPYRDRIAFSIKEELAPDAYLGLAVLLASVAESVAPDLIGPDASLGPLGPYLRRETENLPDLPVPPRFQELFRQWARGEVKFVEWVPEPPAT